MFYVIFFKKMFLNVSLGICLNATKKKSKQNTSNQLMKKKELTKHKMFFLLLFNFKQKNTIVSITL